MMTTQHWPSYDTLRARRGVGIGATQEDLTNAAQSVMDYFAANPCTQASIPAVQFFQATYNASGMPGHLTEDGQYGGNTERALQNALNMAPAAGGGGPVQTAPKNCFGMSVPDVPALDPTPSGGATTTTTTSTPATSTTHVSSAAVALAVAAVVGGVGYAVYRARKRHH